MQFEWDHNKASANLRKHGVSFTEAATVFGDPLSITVEDPDHSFNEDRFMIIGSTLSGRLLIVSFVDRDDHIRIISARELTSAERKSYEKAINR
jgi:uncharacterized DUF497 family protein